MYMKQYKQYYQDQFTPANLRRASMIVEKCIIDETPIDIAKIDDNGLVADLYIVKCMLIVKYRESAQKKIHKNKK